jgi:uncharacterized membrane protein
VVALDRDLDVEALAAGRLNVRLEPERVERVAEEERGPDDVGERDSRRVEVERA